MPHFARLITAIDCELRLLTLRQTFVRIPSIPMSEPPSLLEKRPEPRENSAQSNYIQPTLSHGLRIWWALYWRSTLATALSLGGSMAALRVVLPSYWSYSADYVIILAMMYFILKKRYRTFRIRLVSNVDRTRELPATFARTFRVWWTFTWRTIVYRVVLSFITGIPVGFLSGAVAVIYPPLGPAFAILVGLVIEGAVGLFTIYSSILDEEMSDFCVTLVPNDRANPIANLPAALPAPGA